MQLLERELFLDVLAGYVDEAVAGTGRFVMITGEAGIGKTSLLEAFRESRTDVRWLWGACDGTFTPQPLGPLHEIALSVGGPLVDLFGPDVDRRLLFSSFLTNLEDSEQPTVVVVEDLHWADEATLDWLVFLARRVARTRTLIAVSYRDDELANDAALQEVVGQITTHRSTSRLTLPPLSTDAIAALAGRNIDAAGVRAITGGNPFYVREMLDSALNEVPASVTDVVTARVARLSQDARALVDAAAVLGRPEEAALIAEVADAHPSALDEAVLLGVLVGEAGRFRFRHELTRLAVEQLVPQYRRTRLHARALLALEKANAEPARLAHHAEAGGEVAATCRYATAAARSAMALRSHREAVAQFERALRGASDLPLAELADVEEGLAEALSLRDDWERSVVHRERAVALRRSLGDADALARNLRRHANALWRLCRGPESDAVAAEMYELMRDAPDSLERAMSLYYYGVGHEPDVDQSEKLITQALRIGEDRGDDGVCAAALLGVGYHQLRRGVDGLPTMVRSLELAKRAGDDYTAAVQYTNVYEIAAAQMRFDEFAWAFDEGMAFVVDADMPVYTYCMRATHATVLMRRGELAGAAGLAHELIGETMSPVNRLHLLIPYTETLFRSGADDGRSRLAELVELARRNGEAEWQVQVVTAAAQGVWLTGDESLLDEELRAWIPRGLETDPWLHGDLLSWLQRIGLPPQGNRPLPEPFSLELDERNVEAAAWWNSRGCPFEEAVALHDAGDEASLQRSLKLFHGLGAEPAAARARRALRALGIRSVARGPRESTRGNPHGLTPRESEILALLQEGLTNAAIAERLVISRRTVDHHVSAVLAKVGVGSRSDLIAT